MAGTLIYLSDKKGGLLLYGARGSSAMQEKGCLKSFPFCEKINKKSKISME